MRSKPGRPGWRSLVALAAVLAGPSGRSMSAEEPPADAAVAEAAPDSPRPPELGGPEVVKLDWNTRRLIAADFDGDGRRDLAVLNNDRARIELLLQRVPGSPGRTARRRPVSDRWEPELEDARFDKLPVTAGITLFDLAAGDLNGDGRTDLAYTGDPDALTVRYGGPDDDWNEKRVFDIGDPSQYLTVLRIADLDGDARCDLLVLLQKELVVLRQKEDGTLAPPERYALSEDNCYSLEVLDLDGDGRRDVAYLAAGRRDGFRVRRQEADGKLGPEVPFRIEISRTNLQPLPRPGGQPPRFAYVQNQTSMLAVVELTPRVQPAEAAEALKLRVYSTQAGTRNPPSYAFGDVDGDGRMDLAVADADGAQILVYFQNAGGELGESRAYPSLTDGRSIAAADWDGDGKAELFVASPKEQTLGEARFTPAGRLAYPQPVPVKGKPLAVDAGVLAPGQKPALAVAIEEGGKRRVDLLTQEGNEAKTIASVELAGLRTDPRALRLVDANQDGRLDVAVFVPFEAMRLLVQDAEGKFTDLSTAPGYRRGLVENLDPSAMTLVDVDGDGKREMLVSGNGFARALRLDADGMLQVADQFNARESGTDVAAAFAADVDGDGKGEREIILFARRDEQLQILRRNPQGVFAYAEAVPVSRLDLVSAVQVDLNRDGREDLFFLGKDRFWTIPIGAPDFEIETVFTHETDLKGISYGDLAVGDLNADGRPDFVMVDPVRNFVEVLAPVEDGVKSVLHFRVFESDPHAPRRGGQGGEPREVLVSDVTGDGREDLVMLVHDRVLVYPNGEIPPASGAE